MEIISSALLSARGNNQHAFFTRRGGVSGSIYASLNCAAGSRDDPQHVHRNRTKVASEFALRPEQLCSPRQAHTTTVLTLQAPFENARPIADALVTRTPGFALSVMGADCAPVLLSDAKAGVIGAAHAGWKGALAGIVEATLLAMSNLGAMSENVAACVGPAIAQPSYEVGTEFRDRFLDHSAANAAFFIAAPNGRWRFDLPGYVEKRLSRAGVESIERIDGDTCADEDRFFSYRRSTLRGEPDYGRQISVISLG